MLLAACDHEAEEISPVVTVTTATPAGSADPLAFRIHDYEVMFHDAVVMPWTDGCSSDAQVVIESGRVARIVRIAHKLAIEVGEEVVGTGGFAEQSLDEPGEPVFRDASGDLRQGYKLCNTSLNCWADGWVLIQNGVVLESHPPIGLPGKFMEIAVGEAVRSDLPPDLAHAVPVVRMSDGVLQFGVLHCNTSDVRENEVPFLFEPEHSMIPMPPILGRQD